MINITKDIYSRIIELSDLGLQIKLWLNQENDTDLISSYSELMCSLFDDFNFDDFVDTPPSEFGFSESVVFELRKLRGLLNN